MRNKRLWFGVFGLLLVLTVVGLTYRAARANKPNFVFILTDDLDSTLMPYLEHTNRLIAQEGATFTNFIITNPLCCPSRATILRGEYSHNTNILENSPGFQNFFRNTREEETIATWLTRGGYQTSLIGKYLNGYPIGAGKRYIPPGWTDWHVYMNQYDSEIGAHYYYDYELNENGELVQYGVAPEDYSTDVFRDKSMQFILKNIQANSPFFLMLSVKPPHGPSLGAPRHIGLFEEVEFPKGPAFQEADISDKPSFTQAAATSGDEFDIHDANSLFVKRIQSMLALDELIRDVVQLLEEHGQLDNTYIIFTSDNGFLMGEHGLPGKGYPYEETILVPMLIRGPGITPNTQVTQLTANHDLAPTFAEMAGVRAADFVDGRSWMPLFQSQPGEDVPWRSGLLIESGYWDNEETHLRYRGIRTDAFIYIEYFNGELEYYDLVNDPYQLDNIAYDLEPSMLEKLHAWLEELRYCKAEGCRIAEMNIPEGLNVKP